MAEQRRYKPSREQVNRALGSGEAAPDTSNQGFIRSMIPDWYERYSQNFAAGLPNNVLQLAQLPEMAGNVWNATKAKIEDPNRKWMTEYGKSAYGGEQGLTEIDHFVKQGVEDYLADLPANERTPEVQKAAEAAVMGSREYHDLLMSKTGAVNQWSDTAQNWVNEQVGLPPVYQQTTTDEIEQLIPTLLVPTPTKIANAVKLGGKGASYVARALEPFLPGVTGPVNAGVNFGVQEGLTQGMRYAGDQPSVITGDAGLTDYGFVTHGGEMSGPATSSNTPAPQRRSPMAEDASAPGPFSMAAAAAEGDVLPFQYGKYRAQPSNGESPLTSAPSVNPTAVIPHPDRDPDNGGDGSGWAKTLGIGAGLTLMGAALRGRLPAGILHKVVQDVDNTKSAIQMQPTATDHITLGSPQPGSNDPTRLTKWQKTKVGAAKQNAPEYVAQNALEDMNDPDIQTKLNKINRETNTATPLEVGFAAKRTYTNGELPGLNRKTEPTTKLRMDFDALALPEQELLKKHIVYNERMDYHKKRLNSMNDDINNGYIALNKITAPAARIKKLTEIRKLENDVRQMNDPQSKFGVENVSVGEARQIIAAGDANPRIKSLVDRMKRVRDDVDESGIAMHQFSRQYINDTMRERPNWLPLTTDPSKYEDLPGQFKTKSLAKRIGAKLAGRHEPHEVGVGAVPMYSGIRSPARTNALVRNVPEFGLLNPIDALETHIHDYHRQIRANRAAQTFTETMMGTKDWGRAIQVAHPPLSIQDFENLRNGTKLKNILSEKNTYVYNKNGQMHIMRAADSEVARAMRHNPSSTIGMVDGMRKTAQYLYTGNTLAPWFAPVAAENDLAVARVMLPSNRVVGPLDALSRKIFPNNTFFRDVMPDPTFKLAQMAAIGKQISARALIRGGEIVGKNMALQSSLLRAMGPIRNSAVGQAMIRTVNEMVEEFKWMEMHNIIDTHQVVEHNERLFQEWVQTKKVLDSIPGVSPVVKEMYHAWMGIVDSVRNAPRVAITSANLAKLSRETNGAPTNKQLRSLIRDMRYMSGDMSKAIGNPLVAGIASASPYGANAINSLTYMLEGVRTNPTVVGTRIMTNMVLPKILWTSMLTMWMGKEFSDYYWDEMPTWQRQGTIPMLSPKYLIEVAQGFATGGVEGVRKPGLGDVIFMRQAPEAIPLAEVAMSAAQGYGWFDFANTTDKGSSHTQDIHTWADSMHAVMSMTNVSFPLFSSAIEMFQESPGKYATDLSSDSDTVARFTNALHAIGGGMFDVVKAGFGAASNAADLGETPGAVITQGMEYALEAAKQRFPETPLSPLFGGQRRHYTKTAVRDRNQAKFGAIDSVSGQLSEQKKNERLPGPKKPETTDHNALSIMRDMHSTANSGVMRSLRKQRSELYSQLERLDEIRGTLPAHEYTRQSENYKMKINDIDRQEEEQFDRLTIRLQNHFSHLGVTDIDSATAYIQSTMHP